MNQQYFDENEDICKNKLIDFNKRHKLFKEITDNGYMASVDFTGITKNGKTANIELKNRNYPSGRFDTLIIEAHKYAKLMIDYLYENKEPLYVNFMNDGTTYIFNLRKMKEKPQFTEKKGYKSNGYQGFELSARILLPITSAYKYD